LNPLGLNDGRRPEYPREDGLLPKELDRDLESALLEVLAKLGAFRKDKLSGVEVVVVVERVVVAVVELVVVVDVVDVVMVVVIVVVGDVVVVLGDNVVAKVVLNVVVIASPLIGRSSRDTSSSLVLQTSASHSVQICLHSVSSQ